MPEFEIHSHVGVFLIGKDHHVVFWDAPLRLKYVNSFPLVWTVETIQKYTTKDSKRLDQLSWPHCTRDSNKSKHRPLGENTLLKNMPHRVRHYR